MSVNVLEAIRFYVSFACSFAFAERELMEGNAKIIKLIARDEALHLTGTQHMLNLMPSRADDSEMAEIAAELQGRMFPTTIKKAMEQEKESAAYLFKDGSIIGLNKVILSKLRRIYYQSAYAGGAGYLPDLKAQIKTRFRGLKRGCRPTTYRSSRRKWKYPLI